MVLADNACPNLSQHNRLLLFLIIVSILHEQAGGRLLYELVNAICACITCLFGSFERCALRKATDMK